LSIYEELRRWSRIWRSFLWGNSSERSRLAVDILKRVGYSS
jgi:hypothetical protein